MLLFLVISSVLIANANGNCPHGSFHGTSDNTCVFYIPTSGTFAEARLACQQNGGDVVMIKDIHKEDAVVVTLLAYSGTFPWIGVVDEDNDLTFTFTDGTALMFPPPWTANPHQAGEHCVYRLTDSRKWESASCDEQHPVVCQKDIVYTCDYGWLSITDTPKCVKAVKGRRLSYTAARQDCQVRGGDLSTSMQMRNHRKMIMKTIKFTDHFWIGVNDVDDDGVTNFVDGSPVTGYQPFKRGKGIDAAKQHMCVSIRRGRWYGKKCNKNRLYICEK